MGGWVCGVRACVSVCVRVCVRVWNVLLEYSEPENKNMVIWWMRE